MPKNSPSILIVKTSSIGDVIQTFPVLEYLRERFPSARIDWVVEEKAAPLLQAHPQLSHLLLINSRQWRSSFFSSKTQREVASFQKRLREVEYDLLFDLQGNTKSALITAMARAKQKVGFDWASCREKSNVLATTKRYAIAETLEVRSRYLKLVQGHFKDETPFLSKGVRLCLTDEEKERLQNILTSAYPKVMVCFGSRWRNKQLSLEQWIGLLETFQKRTPSYFYFVYSDEKEKKDAESLHKTFPESLCVGEMTLPLWQALMWEMQAVITVDSAALHLAATTPIPTFSFFGPSLAAIYKPPGAQHRAYQGTCPYGKSFLARCPALRSCESGACLKSVEVATLTEALEKSSEESLVSLQKSPHPIQAP